MRITFSLNKNKVDKQTQYSQHDEKFNLKYCYDCASNLL